MTTTIPAIIGHYSEPETQVDPARLTYASGFPSHDGVSRLDWRVWDGHWDPRQEKPLAHLETAIVCDRVDHMTIPAPGVTSNEKLIAWYDIVRDDRLRSFESHHIYVAWRLVREADGEVLYDSLTQAGRHWRVVGAGVPMGWGDVVRELKNDGRLPRNAH